MNPTVSIIIPFYNCKFVAQAINSALTQTYPNIEIIVVDDGSTKEVERVHPFMNRIIYVRKENGGTATALNEGIRRAKGEYIAWLSSDDYFLPAKIEKQIRFMMKHRAKASFHNYDFVNEANEVVLPFNGKRFHNARDVYRSFLNQNPVNGCSVMLHKEVFSKTGYFSTNLMFTQDYEMWYRLLLNGYPMFYLDEVLLKYRAHEQSGTSQNQIQIKREIFFIRHHYNRRMSQYLLNHGAYLKSITF
jgi:teichuronic acid biosynthesis glycosyltransferase TuaG